MESEVTWEWVTEGDEQVCRIGAQTFRYDPTQRTMRWRGIIFYGVSRHDINAFVANRINR